MAERFSGADDLLSGALCVPGKTTIEEDRVNSINDMKQEVN